MIRGIAGFHQDAAGDWVAELSCLHAQHIRHRPPFTERAWVLDTDGRTDRIGSQIECPLCDRAELPNDLAHLRTAGPWDAGDLPAGLRRPHRTAEGVWGVVHVDRGRVRLRIAVDPPMDVELGPGQIQAIPPATVHEVQLDEWARLRLEFLGAR